MGQKSGSPVIDLSAFFFSGLIEAAIYLGIIVALLLTGTSRKLHNYQKRGGLRR
jgi:hypothetical protein